MPLENVVIRRADIADADVITDLSVTTFTETFARQNDAADMAQYISEEMNLAQLSAELRDSNNYFFLASFEGEHVGYAKVRDTKIPPELSGRKPLELERIYVKQTHHGKKIGTALMQHCIAHANTHKYDVVWLGVWEYNHKAVNFYKQWRFELFGSHIFRLGSDEQTDVLMKIEL